MASERRRKAALGAAMSKHRHARVHEVARSTLEVGPQQGTKSLHEGRRPLPFVICHSSSFLPVPRRPLGQPPSMERFYPVALSVIYFYRYRLRGQSFHGAEEP